MKNTKHLNKSSTPTNLAGVVQHWTKLTNPETALVLVLENEPRQTIRATLNKLNLELPVALDAYFEAKGEIAPRSRRYRVLAAELGRLLRSYRLNQLDAALEKEKYSHKQEELVKLIGWRAQSPAARLRYLQLTDSEKSRGKAESLLQQCKTFRQCMQCGNGIRFGLSRPFFLKALSLARAKNDETMLVEVLPRLRDTPEGKQLAKDLTAFDSSWSPKKSLAFIEYSGDTTESVRQLLPRALDELSKMTEGFDEATAKEVMTLIIKIHSATRSLNRATDLERPDEQGEFHRRLMAMLPKLFPYFPPDSSKFSNLVYGQLYRDHLSEPDIAAAVATVVIEKSREFSSIVNQLPSYPKELNDSLRKRIVELGSVRECGEYTRKCNGCDSTVTHNKLCRDLFAKFLDQADAVELSYWLAFGPTGDIRWPIAFEKFKVRSQRISKESWGKILKWTPLGSQINDYAWSKCWKKRPVVVDETPPIRRSIIPKKAPDLAPLIRDWEKFYEEQFNMKYDFSSVTIPKWRTGFDRLIIVAADITVDQVYERSSSLFKTWKLWEHSLDKEVVTNERSPSNGTYAIWVRNRVEPDLQHRNKTLESIKRRGLKTETLLERLLHGLKFYLEKGKHLDVENITTCPGSKSSNNGMAAVLWNDGTEAVDILHYGSLGPNSRCRIREVVA